MPTTFPMASTDTESPRLLHPADDEIAPRLVFLGEGEPAHTAALDRAYLRQRVDAPE